MYTNELAEQAAKLGIKRWAIVAPNYEFGQSAAAAFKEILKRRIPDASIVAEQYPTLGKMDVGAVANAIEEAKPDGIFNVLFGADMALFARDGLSRGLFDKRTVLSIASGYPEYLLPMKDQVPEGWITQGYPWADITTPEHKAFVAAYMTRFNEPPRAFSMMGYVALMMIKTAIRKGAFHRSGRARHGDERHGLPIHHRTAEDPRHRQQGGDGDLAWASDAEERYRGLR